MCCQQAEWMPSGKLEKKLFLPHTFSTKTDFQLWGKDVYIEKLEIVKATSTKVD